jgi:hypothetical protein
MFPGPHRRVRARAHRRDRSAEPVRVLGAWHGPNAAGTHAGCPPSPAAPVVAAASPHQSSVLVLSGTIARLQRSLSPPCPLPEGSSATITATRSIRPGQESGLVGLVNLSAQHPKTRNGCCPNIDHCTGLAGVAARVPLPPVDRGGLKADRPVNDSATCPRLRDGLVNGLVAGAPVCCESCPGHRDRSATDRERRRPTLHCRQRLG